MFPKRVLTTFTHGLSAPDRSRPISPSDGTLSIAHLAPVFIPACGQA